jgi:hypothetical protein
MKDLEKNEWILIETPLGEYSLGDDAECVVPRGEDLLVIESVPGSSTHRPDLEAFSTLLRSAATRRIIVIRTRQ